MPVSLLIDENSKILTDEHYLKYRNNIFKTDVLIIDEISMIYSLVACK
jgi:hypothetical protein